MFFCGGQFLLEHSVHVRLKSSQVACILFSILLFFFSRLYYHSVHMSKINLCFIPCSSSDPNRMMISFCTHHVLCISVHRFHFHSDDRQWSDGTHYTIWQQPFHPLTLGDIYSALPLLEVIRGHATFMTTTTVIFSSFCSLGRRFGRTSLSFVKYFLRGCSMFMPWWIFWMFLTAFMMFINYRLFLFSLPPGGIVVTRVRSFVR